MTFEEVESESNHMDCRLGQIMGVSTTGGNFPHQDFDP